MGSCNLGCVVSKRARVGVQNPQRELWREGMPSGGAPRALGHPLATLGDWNPEEEKSNHQETRSSGLVSEDHS